MAGEDLRKAVLTKPGPQKQVVADKDNQSPLENPQNWKDALKKIQTGWPTPDRIFYVVIAAGTVVDTPQKLKDIAEMSSAPNTFKTVYKGLHTVNPAPEQMGKDGKPMPVTVGAVRYEELRKIQSKADCVVDLWVLMDGQTRGATKVINYKKPAGK
ncbi:hypothetical protein SLS64_005703 [Diaporthe eres]|uniref:Uncharacterized protein n=1 Tax=Diaporthe eres TaxID=83184 RepID=A0ABR1NTG7_DIAER